MDNIRVLSGYWRIDHKDYYAIVWGGIICETADVSERWQKHFRDSDITVRPCTKEEAEEYKARGLEITDLEDDMWILTRLEDDQARIEMASDYVWNQVE